MAHLRTPLIQSYSNPFSLCLKPAPIVHLCISEDPKSPRQNSQKKKSSPKANRNFPKIRFENHSTYHKMMENYAAKNINTLTNLKSENSDYAKNSGIVVIIEITQHALQFMRTSQNELDQIETVFSFFQEDPLSTKIQSPRSYFDSQISQIQDFEEVEIQTFQSKTY